MNTQELSSVPFWRAATALAAVCALSVALTACAPADETSPVADPPTTAQSEADDSTTEASGDDESDQAEDSESQDSSSGGSNSGSSSSSGTDSSGSTTSGASPAASASPAANPSAAPSAAPPAGGTISSAIASQRCSGGKLLVTVTANYDNSYRKGITAVTFERQNEYNVWLDFDGSWLGQYTGQGNVWSGSLAGNQQNIGKTLRVTVESAGAPTQVYTAPITSPC